MFHENMNYAVKDSLYATLGESENRPEFTQTNECCIYVNYALIAIDKNEDIDFMQQRQKNCLKRSICKSIKRNYNWSIEELGEKVLSILYVDLILNVWKLHIETVKYGFSKTYKL